MSRRLATILTCFASLAWPAAVLGQPYLPPPGGVFAGVTGGGDVGGFSREVGKHPPVFQFFSSWNQSTQWMVRQARASHARLMIHIGTVTGSREQITPRGIAMGHGDDYLLRLAQHLAESGNVVYLRLMAEMDGHWNAYSAFKASGRPRGGQYTTQMFKRAWQRSVLIVRGGPVNEIDRKLAALSLPPVATSEQALPRPRVAFLWVPQVAGAPDTAANSPRAYWPGGHYVDWVGTDFYSRFPNFSGLERFYREFPGKPFAFGEWALWGRDDPGFVSHLFAWARSHRRVRMLMYNQGNRTNGPFRLARYPRSRSTIARELSGARFVPFAPEFR